MFGSKYVFEPIFRRFLYFCVLYNGAPCERSETMFGGRRGNIDKEIATNLDALVRFAYLRVNDRPEAEDIVYEAVLRLLENPGKVKDARRYLFRIVYNLILDKYRQGRTMIPADGIDIPEADGNELLDQEEITRINRLLDDLPPNEAEIVRMSVVDELSFVEISHLLDIPQSTAKSRFYSGMKKLKEKYFTNNQ